MLNDNNPKTMKQNGSLKNDLNENKPSTEDRHTELNDREDNSLNKTEKLPKEDIIDKLFRGFMAFFFAVFLSAIIAGMLEVAQNWEIPFGSLPMIAITTFFYYPCYKILTWMGFFRQK